MYTAKSKALFELRACLIEFGRAHHQLVRAIYQYDHLNYDGFNSLYGATERYPYDKSFDELLVTEWTDAIVESLDMLKIPNDVIEAVNDVLGDVLDDNPSAEVEDAIHLVMGAL